MNDLLQFIRGHLGQSLLNINSYIPHNFQQTIYNHEPQQLEIFHQGIILSYVYFSSSILSSGFHYRVRLAIFCDFKT